VKLSKRRLELLEALADLVNQKGSPVHYIDVSEKMNVSKWTAYDMMRELADDGLVEASYSLSPTGSPGRSQVLFSPPERGYSLVESGREQSRDPQLPDQWDDEWQYLKDDLLEQIHMASNKETSHLLDLLKGKYSSSPLAYCAAFLGFLIIESKRRGLDLVALSGILEIGMEKGMTLPMFTGLLIGGLLVREARKILPDIENLIHAFSHQLQHLEQSSEDMLLEFAQAIVNNGVLAQGGDNTPSL